MCNVFCWRGSARFAFLMDGLMLIGWGNIVQEDLWYDNAMDRKPFYYKETQGIRITVRPLYLPEHSQPALRRYVFAYFIRIENVGPITVQLLSRYWLIVDSIGDTQEVTGDGVVGQQPVLKRGEVHEYNSFCVLKSAHGYMEGSYRFIRTDDTLFDAIIPRFYLDVEEEGEPL